MLERYLNREHDVFLLPVAHWQRWFFVFSWENRMVALGLPRCLYLSPQLISQTARAENPLKKHSTSTFLTLSSKPPFWTRQKVHVTMFRRYQLPISGLFWEARNSPLAILCHITFGCFSALDGPTFSQKRWPSKGRVNNFHRQRWFYLPALFDLQFQNMCFFFKCRKWPWKTNYYLHI